MHLRIFMPLMISGCISAMLTVALNANAQTGIAKTTNHPISIVTCGLADGRSAKVTLTDNRFTYEFGRKAILEIKLVGNAGTKNVFKSKALFPRVGWTQIRFTNGTTSYLLFHYFNFGNYVRDYEGAAEESGLIIFQDGHRLSMRLCRTAGGLEDDTNLATLPDDPEDHSSDIIDDVEHHR